MIRTTNAAKGNAIRISTPKTDKIIPMWGDEDKTRRQIKAIRIHSLIIAFLQVEASEYALLFETIIASEAHFSV